MTAKISRQRGFTLLETMIAIAVLLIGVVGPISIIGDALSKIYFARDQAIAVNLAQEGIEAIRQARDTNILKGNAWETGFTPSQCGVSFTKACVIDFSSAGVGANIQSCGGACTATESLVYTNSDGLYHQYQSSVPGTAVATIFHRTVKAQTISTTEDKVTSTITWTTGNIPGSVSVSESIFRWAQL